MSRVFLVFMMMSFATAKVFAKAGDDLVAVFAKAHAGAPLRVVALGGSITQAGGGWIGPWLRTQFPRSLTTLANAGMSATGSGLAVFRIERDVLSLQPHVVLIETTVNDEGGSDAEILRSVESLVVRLKSLNPPPAMVILHSASRNGLNKARHAAVARHYGSLEIDLDSALKNYLQREKKSWDEFMSDTVHPNAAGNKFYAEAIASELQPFVTSARGAKPQSAPSPLPRPMSRLPLWLDGQMAPASKLAQSASGWNAQSTLIDTRTGQPQWWGQFFNGVLSAEAPGTTLEIPFRGTSVGLLYALQPGFGNFYASVDGGLPQLVATGVREGYESRIFAQDLTPGEHRLTIVLPPASDGKIAPVKLGALLLAGAREVKGDSQLAPLGPYHAEVLRSLTFATILPSQWRVAGPFGVGEAPAGGGFSPDFETQFAPEANASAVDWKAVTESQAHGDVLDFAVPGQKPRGVFYATSTFTSARGGSALLQITLDYFAKVWLNGREVIAVRDTHGHPRSPLLFPIKLQAGENKLLVKLHPGSGGADFSLAIAELSRP